MLDWLAGRARAIGASGKQLWNQVAALEILAKFNYPKLADLIEIALGSEFGPQCLYVIATARALGPLTVERRQAIANRAISLYSEAHQEGGMGTKWGRRFSVEIIRALSSLSPEGAVGEICQFLPQIGATEITAVLDAIVTAARALDMKRVSASHLDHALDVLWNRYGDKGSEILNRPGVLGDILELKGRITGSLSDFIVIICTYELELKSQILYLFAERPLDFLAHRERLAWYRKALEALAQTQQFEEFHQVIAKGIGEVEGDHKRMYEIWSLANTALSGLRESIRSDN